MTTMTKQELINFNITNIKRFDRLYAESTSLGEKEAFIDAIHAAKLDLVKHCGFTWKQVEQIA